jgi:hypothetical protein
MIQPILSGGLQMKKIVVLIFMMAFGVSALAMAAEQVPAAGSGPAASTSLTPAAITKAPEAKTVKKPKKTKKVKKLKKEEPKPASTPAA